jgi:prepilin-type N-terminal cleavage/methylation domain-containing protein
MIRQNWCTGRCRRRGFSMMEMIVASTLAAMLGILLVQATVTFGRPALEVEARARITQEAMLATQSLAYDLGGFLPNIQGQALTLDNPSTAWGTPTGESHVLSLTFGGTTILYFLQGNQLVRSDSSSTAGPTTIANYVKSFTVASYAPNPASPTTQQLQLTITIAYPNPTIALPDLQPKFSGTYTLIAVRPSS